MHLAAHLPACDDSGMDQSSKYSTGELLASARRLVARHTVSDGGKFRLSKCDPGDTGPFTDGERVAAKESTKSMLADGVKILAELQDKLYAQDRWSLLLVFQAMDAAGKDGVIKHVMSGINPQGCEVHSFKAPSAEELDHDFMWRCSRLAPRRGMIGIFNRSYYEEVLVVRVHSEYLKRQQLPRELVTKEIWDERFQDIRKYERYLARQGTIIRKFFLHVSKDEQRRRFLERIEDPAKHWKFSAADIRERRHWDDYQAAYAEAISATSTADAPWYVIPADHKWFARLVAAAAIVDALRRIDPRFPEVAPEARVAQLAARDELLAEG